MITDIQQWEREFLANRHDGRCPALWDTTGTAGCACRDSDGHSRPLPPPAIPVEEWVDGDLAKRCRLTRRQAEVLTGFAQGLTDDAMARSLGVTDNTISTHARRLFAALGVQSRAEAVATAYDCGLLRTRALRDARALQHEAGAV